MDPSWSWISVLPAKVVPQSGMPGFSLVEAMSMDIVAQPDAESAVGALKYHCSPGTSMRLRCALVPLTGLIPEVCLSIRGVTGKVGAMGKARKTWSASGH